MAINNSSFPSSPAAGHGNTNAFGGSVNNVRGNNRSTSKPPVSSDFIQIGWGLASATNNGDINFSPSLLIPSGGFYPGSDNVNGPTTRIFTLAGCPGALNIKFDTQNLYFNPAYLATFDPGNAPGLPGPGPTAGPNYSIECSGTAYPFRLDYLDDLADFGFIDPSNPFYSKALMSNQYGLVGGESAKITHTQLLLAGKYQAIEGPLDGNFHCSGLVTFKINGLNGGSAVIGQIQVTQASSEGFVTIFDSVALLGNQAFFLSVECAAMTIDFSPVSGVLYTSTNHADPTFPEDEASFAEPFSSIPFPQMDYVLTQHDVGGDESGTLGYNNGAVITSFGGNGLGPSCLISLGVNKIG